MSSFSLQVAIIEELVVSYETTLKSCRMFNQNGEETFINQQDDDDDNQWFLFAGYIVEQLEECSASSKG